MNFYASFVTLVVALATIEAGARWWMNPASDRPDHGVIRYPHPAATPATDREATAESPVVTLLPEIYDHAAPMLRCTHGHVHHVDLGDGVGMHVAYFHWDGTDTGSVLEAFRHMPEACMGALGLQLVSRERPILFSVPDSAGGDSTLTLVFDHTVFRDPRGSSNPLLPAPLVHAFRAVWVAGVDEADPRTGLRGRQFTDLRSIRLDAAKRRFRPPEARVIQGAVRGIPNGESAWEAFRKHVLEQIEHDPPGG